MVGGIRMSNPKSRTCKHSTAEKEGAILRLPPPHQRRKSQSRRGIAVAAGVPTVDQFSLGVGDPRGEQAFLHAVYARLRHCFCSKDAMPYRLIHSNSLKNVQKYHYSCSLT